MKNIILSSKAKIAVDFLLMVLLLATFISGEMEIIPKNYWRSFHCIIGCLWVLFILLHIVQHGKVIKALPKKNVFLKNKITALITLGFILIFFSILSLIAPAGKSIFIFHHVIGQLFCIFVIVHTIQKWKRFTGLFRKK